MCVCVCLCVCVCGGGGGGLDCFLCSHLGLRKRSDQAQHKIVHIPGGIYRRRNRRSAHSHSNPPPPTPTPTPPTPPTHGNTRTRAQITHSRLAIGNLTQKKTPQKILTQNESHGSKVPKSAFCVSTMFSGHFWPFFCKSVVFASVLVKIVQNQVPPRSRRFLGGPRRSSEVPRRSSEVLGGSSEVLGGPSRFLGGPRRFLGGSSEVLGGSSEVPRRSSLI